MKPPKLYAHLKLLSLFTAIFLCVSLKSFEQVYTWQQKTSLPASPRFLPTSFSIGNKGYMGLGFNFSVFLKDFWEYDPSADVWTQKADFGGGLRSAAAGFAIGNKGYVGTGSLNPSDVTTKEFWEFDPAANIWTRKADFPGASRTVAQGFTIGDKGYLGLGRTGGFGLFADFWEYDPVTDNWTQKANFTGGARYATSGFSIGNKGYIGTGTDFTGGGFTFRSDFWEYDQASNQWTQKANFAGGARELAVGFSISNKGYIGTGLGASDFWEFDPTTNIWNRKADFGGGGRNMSTGFAICGKGYLGMGVGSGVNNDLWEYSAEITSFQGAEIPTITASLNPICNGSNTTLSISSGNLNNATSWKWYTNSCGSTLIGTGTSITVNPVENTIYYVRGEGGCVVPGDCGTFSVTINNNPPSITCSGPVTINTTPGLCTGTTTLTPPTVIDNCNSFGNALSFAGGYVDVPNSSLLNPFNEWTLESWVKRTNTGVQESLIEKYIEPGNTYGYLLRILSNDRAMAGFVFGSFGGYFITGTTTILPNTWYHLSTTVNRTTGVMKLYVNGVLDAQVTGMTGLPTIPNTASLKLGARGDDAASKLSNGGLIDEMRIWNVERTQAQIQSSMNRELSAQVGLVALYHFNQGIADGNNAGITTAFDASGNNNNGNLLSFALTGPTSNWVGGQSFDPAVTNNAPAIFPIGNTTVTWTATDANGNTATCSQMVTVIDNQPPTINSVSGPVDPVVVNIPINLNVTYSGNNITSASIIWGDVSPEQTIAFPSNNFIVPHTYNVPGVYTAIVTLKNNCGVISIPYQYQYVVVYDANGGFVTGGGWINSLAGAYRPDLTLSGKANFGFESKYQKGTSVPSGNTQFKFQTGGMNFKSTNYDWLVIAGSRAQFKGTGTINGSGNFGFILTAVDGDLGNNVYPDLFRIKIWDKNNADVIVYDNQYGASDGDALNTQIAGGSIVIHKPSMNTVSQSENIMERTYSSEVTVKVLTNPSSTQFTLKVQTDNNESMKLRVVDILGRVVETKQNLQPDQMIHFGEMYRAGVYFVEIIQGKNRKLVKLVKM
ncbi:MAG TPA: LamG-like jellyroll fold domain-containing protein [Chitinophagaceae bacterium]|nr:LamG-like jellyroll fold domain-containing protein [Chitinophagaceae bacterium]